MLLSFIQRLLHRQPQKKKGQSLIVVALAMLMIFAILAVTLNVQQLVNTRATAQTAADSAALAGANIQAQGKELIKTFEILRFLRDEIVAVVQSVAIIVRDIGYIFLGIGIVADAASPFCFCAGMWAFPIAESALVLAGDIDEVATEVDETTQPLDEALKAAEDAVVYVAPFIALINAYNYGQRNGADFTIPLPLPLGSGFSGTPYDGRKSPEDTHAYMAIAQDRAALTDLQTVQEPQTELYIHQQHAIADVLALKIDTSNTSLLQETQNDFNAHDDQGNSVCHPPSQYSQATCDAMQQEITQAEAQQLVHPDDREQVQKAQDDFHTAGCDQNPPPDPSQCPSLQTAIDNAQTQLTNDTNAMNTALQNVDNGKNHLNDLHGQEDSLKQDIAHQGDILEQDRKDDDNIDDANLRKSDISFGVYGMEGTLVIVVKNGQPPPLNFGGANPGQTWAAAFGETVTTNDNIYEHTSDNSLYDAALHSDNSIGSAAAEAIGWVINLLVDVSKGLSDARDAIIEQLNKICSSFCTEILSQLPAFAVVAPDMHDVRPRLVKVDGGFTASLARVGKADEAYQAASELKQALDTANEIIQDWQTAASILGIPGPGIVPITGQFDLNNPDSFF